MPIDPATIDAMVAAGFTAEQMAVVLKSELLAERAAVAAADEARKARARDGNRERKARQRARETDVTDVTHGHGVTHRDERDPPPKIYNSTPHHDSPADPEGSSAPKPRKARNRALPTDWQPGERSERVRQELGRSTEWMRSTATEMRAWAESKGEIRSDWDATHDGWMRREAKREGGSPPSGRPPPRGSPSERRSNHGPLSLLASLHGASHDPSGSFHDNRTLDHDPADGRPDRPLHEPDGGPSGRAEPEGRVRYLRTG